MFTVKEAIALSAATLVLSTSAALAGGDDEIPFDVASIYLELNDTDGDLGFQALIDGEGWRRLQIEGPDERGLLNVRNRGRLARQGLTELFFESAEPGFDELPPEVFLGRFPEGEYEVEGVTLDGEELESVAEVTHLLPAPPGNLSINGVPAAEDCDAVLPVVGAPIFVDWDPVTRSHPEIGRTDEPLEIVRYQLVVELDEPAELVYSVDLPPKVTELGVPDGFVALGEEFKVEIIAREASGNQTAVESCFIVAD